LELITSKVKDQQQTKNKIIEFETETETFVDFKTKTKLLKTKTGRRTTIFVSNYIPIQEAIANTIGVPYQIIDTVI